MIRIGTNVTTTGAQAGIINNLPLGGTFQVVGTVSSGTGSATVNCEVSNDGQNWLQAATITLALSTTAASDGFALNASWMWVRANVTALTGTGATLNVFMN